MNTYKLKMKTFQVTCADSVNTEMDTLNNALAFFRSLFNSLDFNQEHMVMACLNTRKKLVGYKHISSGTDDATLCKPHQVFRAALILGGTSIILCHNHPSGFADPSREDIQLTKNCRAAGELLGIELCDHLILGNDSNYYSFFKESGLFAR